MHIELTQVQIRALVKHLEEARISEVAEDVDIRDLYTGFDALRKAQQEAPCT